MSATSEARLREQVRRADLPDLSLTNGKLYTIQAACHEFLRKRGLIHRLTSRYSALPAKTVDRLDPVLPLSPGRAERHGFEYYRHGTLSLYAALDTRTGEVLGKTSPRHTSSEFVEFLGQILASQPACREIHIIADNLSAHKTKQVSAFLAANPNLRIHYTPTYASWLNQVENWFSKIQRQVISRGIFHSVNDLARKLMRFIHNYNKTATPIRWTFSNEKHRISPAI
jgi:transposase